MTTGTEQTALPPVKKSVTVPWPPEAAFRRFTVGIAGWWPTATHSVGQADVETVVFEEREGGRVYERIRGGRTEVWGTVLAWDPPRRFVMSWHPGRGPETAQELEVTFSPVEGGTRVDLTHTGWERLPEKPEEMRARYDAGWDPVLAAYGV